MKSIGSGPSPEEERFRTSLVRFSTREEPVTGEGQSRGAAGPVLETCEGHKRHRGKSPCVMLLRCSSPLVAREPREKRPVNGGQLPRRKENTENKQHGEKSKN